MGLPKIVVNQYETQLPSTGEVIQFRPYTVKEEKVLLIAAEEKNPQKIIQCIQEIVQACLIDYNKPVTTLPSYDLDYLFIKMRTKSVGETSTIMYRCPHCNHENEIDINLDEAKVIFPENYKNPNLIEINEQYKVEMQHPSYSVIQRHTPADDLALNADNNMANDTIQTINLIAACMTKLYDTHTGKVIDRNEFNDSDAAEFIDCLTASQFERLSKTLTDAPKLSLTHRHTCVSCGESFDITLEGLSDFFT